jgi:membrane peptidoglycan carboxypeptidase
VAEKERLRYGRDRRTRRAKPPVDPNASRWERIRARHKRRRAAKKRRLAKMSRRRRILRRFGIAGTWILALLTVGVVSLVAMFYVLSDVPRPETLPLPQVATIEYSDGSTMARIGTVNRTIVSLDKVPEAVRYAVIAAEDRNFYSEPGVSIKGTVRAAMTDLTGGDTQGGSSITQQYAKNAYLTDARTLSRKLKELMIAVKLARDYSKNQILEFYLNTVYFGRGTYGIQAASQAYFGKDVGQLDAAEGAVLAASLRAPSYYDPAVNPAEAKARWHYVIDGMAAIGKLTKQQAETMQYPTVRSATNEQQLGADGWKYFIYRQVVADLVAHGVSEGEINQRGLTIRTTINRKAQAAARSALRTTFSDLTPKQRNYKNALTAVNPATGAVLAYYGGPNGTGYDGKPDYNDYAGVGARPAGSSFKPFTLATVLSQTLTKAADKPHLTISSHVDGSQCVKIEGLQICNDPSDAPYSGSSVTIAYAMKYSLNTTFDLLASQAGPDNVAKTAHAMGIAPTDSHGNPTLVDSNGHTGFGIGIGDYAVSPLDQASAFGTLANGGRSTTPYFVQSATDSSGKVVYRHKKASQRAIDSKVANDVTLTLEPIAGNSGFGLDGGRRSAAKTGTVGIGTSSPKNSDAWTVGFTPQVSAAVWAGSGDSTHAIYDRYGNAEYGRDLPGHTWKLFMDTYLAGKPNLPLPDTQQIGTANTAPTTTASATKTAPSTTSSSSTPAPKPTFSIITTFPPVTPTPPTPTPTPTTPTPTPTPTPTCKPGVLGSTCTTSPAPPAP